MIRDITRLEHILMAIELAERIAARGEDEFMLDDIAQAAMVRQIEIVGEAIKQLSKEVKAAHPHIKWRRYTGTRDFIAHVYFGVLLDRVWLFAINDLAELKPQVNELLRDLAA